MTLETIIYEQPLNEPMRLCLRLEYLFHEFAQHLSGSSPTESHVAIIALVKILNVLDRPDIKSKLTQTLIQQASTLASLEHSTQVDQIKLKELLHRLDLLIDQLNSIPGKIGESLRSQPFINQVRLHLHNPVGPGGFNNPAFNLWLRQPSEERIETLKSWMNELTGLNDIVGTILRITRDSAPLHQIIAEQGFFQQSLDPNLPCHLIRAIVPIQHRVYPEISVGKHRLSIRFVPLETHLPSADSKNHESLSFHLSYCRF